MTTTTALSWPASRLGEALTALARHAGLAVRTDTAPALPEPLRTAPADQLGRWIEATADWLGCEAEPVNAPCSEVERCLAGAAPGLLRLPGANEARFLLLLGGRRRLTLLTPEHTLVRLPCHEVRGALCQAVEAPHREATERLLTEAGLPGRRRPRARQALLRELVGQMQIDVGWILRPTSSEAGTGSPCGGLPRLLVVLLGAHLGISLLWILSWWLLGAMSLSGRPEIGWLTAWLLLLLTLVPFRLLSTLVGGLLSLRAGTILKRRLLMGALRLEPDEVRCLGVGQLLGRVLEADVVATLALTGGFLALTAGMELVLAAFLFWFGAGSRLHVALLLCMVLATTLLTWIQTWRRRQWTEQRLDLTDDLVERMVGHRTRLAQLERSRWHAGEDEALERYLGTSVRLDWLSVLREVLVPRGWFVVALLGLAPAFVWGGRLSPLLVVSVGGIVLVSQALRSLGEGLDQLVAVVIAWERVRLFWRAAALRQPAGHPHFAIAPHPAAGVPPGAGGHSHRSGAGGHSHRSGGGGAPADAESGPAMGPLLLDAHGLVFRHGSQSEAILQGTDVRIAVGDRLLLEGPSGGGKSTLAMVLAGGRTPEAGLLLLGGLDPATVGVAGWRRRVVLAPQFHDNHVLMGTFAFNALLGREWPPPADLEEAERVCRALGLGPLLERMPAGLQQMIGETGWQLSHGEKSRLYLARALLQRADLLILDESFAALDPWTLQQTLTFVLEQAPTVVVIAHP